MEKQTIKIEIETLKYGQPRAYADSEYEFIVKVDGMNEYNVKIFCTQVLYPCSQSIMQWDKEDPGSYFSGYYSFEKIEDNVYKYYVFRPYCD